jgi:predicted phage terminase large subunit-like protein
MIPEYVRKQAKLELARRSIWEYSKLRHPDFYKEDREYLKTICKEIQDFIEQKDKVFLLLNMPPRHGKSFTVKNSVEWLFGHNPKLKILTGSYNEILSGIFATQVRNTIQEEKTDNRIVYSDIFPNTKIKYGEASAKLWALEGQEEKSYLATSPTGTSTGLGADIVIIDDLIKNDMEAYNELTLEKHWSWFTNTILSRLEGNDWKVIIVMTRWSENDLAGRLLQSEYKNLVKQISFPVVQEDGSMLCDEIMNRQTYELKIKEMNQDIAEANYNQELIDMKNRLYGEFKIWQELPKYNKKSNYTDTADTGSDYFCSINYIEYEKEVYITDILFTQESMDITEDKCADLLYLNDVNEAIFESNNGGRYFSKKVADRIKQKYNSNKCVIRPKVQRNNKESRILANATWVNEHIYMPFNWQHKYPEFYKHIKNFMRKGKNEHDDGADVLTAIAEQINQKPTIQVGYSRII